MELPRPPDVRELTLAEADGGNEPLPMVSHSCILWALICVLRVCSCVCDRPSCDLAHRSVRCCGGSP